MSRTKVDAGFLVFTKKGNDQTPPMPGTARLPIVVPVAIISFFYAAVLDYALPLYFSALREAANGGDAYPADLWSQLVKYQVTAWLIGPIVAGVLARRYGERVIWSVSLLGQLFIPIALAVNPAANLIPLIALWQGVTGALMWTAGIALVQMVPPAKMGLANGLMMTALGLGSFCGPLAGRFLLYRQELLALSASGHWDTAVARLATFAPMQTTPQVTEFFLVYVILGASTLLCGLLVGVWGQHPGEFDQAGTPDWSRTLRDVGRLARMPKFWVMTLNLCLLGGLTLHASNQFLPYRAEDIGLKNGAQDSGWIWLQLLRTLMWLPGGAAVGYFAGRRASGSAAAIMVASSVVAAIGIGLSNAAWQMYIAVGVFEFVRQFVRWLQTGYMAEYMPSDLRATTIGFALAIAGLGSTIFGWVAAFVWNPTTHSASPFFVAAALGAVASLALWVYDRVRPLRNHAPPSPEAQLSVVSD